MTRGALIECETSPLRRLSEFRPPLMKRRCIGPGDTSPAGRAPPPTGTSPSTVAEATHAIADALALPERRLEGKHPVSSLKRWVHPGSLSPTAELTLLSTGQGLD